MKLRIQILNRRESTTLRFFILHAGQLIPGSLFSYAIMLQLYLKHVFTAIMAEDGEEKLRVVGFSNSSSKEDTSLYERTV